MKKIILFFLLLLLPALPVSAIDYTSQYPPEQNSTYIHSTSTYGENWLPEFSTDPTKPLTGGWNGAQWLATPWVFNNWFQIDLGSAKTIKRIYYENCHHGGSYTGCGVKDFIFYGSNDPADFADQTYGNIGNWQPLTTASSVFERHPESYDIVDPHYILVTNNTAYRYYGFRFSSNYLYGEEYFGVRRIELQSISSPTPTPTPTPAAPPISQCPLYYNEWNEYAVKYCGQTFSNITFPTEHICATHNIASVGNSIVCGSGHIPVNGYAYYNLTGFDYQGDQDRWLMPVYPSEIRTLEFHVTYSNRVFGYCTAWYMVGSEKYTDSAAAVSVDEHSTGEGWYATFGLDKELYQEIQPDGIAISCDNDASLLQYNYHHDQVFDEPNLLYTWLKLDFPASAILAPNIHEGEATPSGQCVLPDCEPLDVWCYIQSLVAWLGCQITSFKLWLSSLYSLKSPYDLMVEQRDLLIDVMDYKSPFGYITTLQGIDWATVLTTEDDITTIPIIDIPIVSYSFISHTATVTSSLHYNFNDNTPLNTQALYYRDILYNFLKIFLGIIFIFWLVFVFSQQVRMIIFGR